MASLKTIGTFAIIIGCFAIIYPRFMHPLVLRAFGMQSGQPKEEDSQFPPHMRQRGPSPADKRPPPMPHDAKDVRQHMRPGPHPGMRAAAEMQKQSQGTGRGMMGIVLPMYAIGISVYLVYTLFKVFNKRGKFTDPYKRRYDNEGEGQVDRMGFPCGLRGDEGGQEYGEGEVHRYLQQKKQERELEDLLVKMDDTRNVSEDEMRALQKRLEETEAQMTRILQAMQTMQSRVTSVAQDTVGGPTGPEAADRDEGEGPEAKQVESVGAATSSADSATENKKASQGSHSRGSSPDTESYEFVKTGASAAADASPSSELSSLPSFEQISKATEGKLEVSGQEEIEEAVEDAEDILLDQHKEEQDHDSSVRHRKAAPAEEK